MVGMILLTYEDRVSSIETESIEESHTIYDDGIVIFGVGE
jgi:hypothetical protein